MEGDFQGDNIVVHLFLDIAKFVSVREALSCNDMHCRNVVFSPKVKCFGMLDIHSFILVYLYYVYLHKSHH